MYTLFTDDPLTDFHHYDTAAEARWQKILNRRPICAGCGERIMEEYCCEHNGDYYCEHCSDCLNELNYSLTKTLVDKEW